MTPSTRKRLKTTSICIINSAKIHGPHVHACIANLFANKVSAKLVCLALEPHARPTVMTHGGTGYAREYHVERYFREIQIARIAPASPQLILSHIAERVLGLPKSY
jgi:alkylation response protein AidB-like acyl-CoA dehydrogenase